MRFSEAFLARLQADVYQHCNIRLDAGETAALAKQLEYVYAKTYDVKYAELKSRRFIPIDTSVDNAADK